MSMQKSLHESFTVESDKCTYTDEHIISDYAYETVVVEGKTVKPKTTHLKFKTQRAVSRTGVMLIGLGGNNGTTCIAGALANKHSLTWRTKHGSHSANYFGSMLVSSTVKLGNDPAGNTVNVPMRNMLPMLNPDDVVWGGWDISGVNLGEAMERSRVIDMDLQRQLKPMMEGVVPLKSIYSPDFIAANQSERADNVLEGTMQENLDQIRKDMREFKRDNGLDKVIVLWTANTERFASLEKGVNDTSKNILASIQNGHSEVSPSTIFAVASILEGNTYINGSPQNTFVPGVLELASEKKVFLAGDDFKSGQTKMKSVLVDFLVSAGIKPVSIVSYNHLGNNDGKNLSSPSQFRSKEISKANVVDDMVESNQILYEPGESPDHVVVIKYVPTVADSKRAMDEYTSEIFLNGTNTIVMHNTCEDSLLATPLIYDLVILAELCERIEMQNARELTGEEGEWTRFHNVLSLLSYMLKAPLVPKGAPVVNALFAQRGAVVNVMRACLGLAPENYMGLEHRMEGSLKEMEKMAVSVDVRDAEKSVGQ